MAASARLALAWNFRAGILELTMPTPEYVRVRPPPSRAAGARSLRRLLIVFERDQIIESREGHSVALLDVGSNTVVRKLR